MLYTLITLIHLYTYYTYTLIHLYPYTLIHLYTYYTYTLIHYLYKSCLKFSKNENNVLKISPVAP